AFHVRLKIKANQETLNRQVTKTIYTSPNHFFLTPFQPYAVSNLSFVFFPLVFLCRPTLSRLQIFYSLLIFSASFSLLTHYIRLLDSQKKKILSLEPTELFITSGENELLLEIIEGDGGVRAPSLVELTIEDSEFTVVGRVKERDEALQDKIHHLRTTPFVFLPFLLRFLLYVFHGTTENGQSEFKEIGNTLQSMLMKRKRWSKMFGSSNVTPVREVKYMMR
ncbi:unnamed protein product, partial [Brassica napus]